jgi:hypothetical protein
MGIRIYLDDIRTPVEKDWQVVRNYYELVNLVNKIGLQNIELISLDHDLGDSAMNEYFTNVSPNFKLDYENITEKTGYDVAKFLVDEFYKINPERIEMNYTTRKRAPFQFPQITTHSANPIGSANIMGYINNFLMNEGQTQNCVRVQIPHTV